MEQLLHTSFAAAPQAKCGYVALNHTCLVMGAAQGVRIIQNISFHTLDGATKVKGEAQRSFCATILYVSHSLRSYLRPAVLRCV